jgi:hypothetical protein
MVNECDVVSRHLQGCNPRLCRLRINGLAPANKYWMYRSHAGVYGPNNPCSLLSTGAWLKRTASVVVLGEKLRWVPWPLCGTERWSQDNFSQEQCIYPTLLTSCERLLYTYHMRYIWSGTIRGLSVGCVWHVSRVFLAGCTSIRIAATLGYE